MQFAFAPQHMSFALSRDPASSIKVGTGQFCLETLELPRFPFF